MGQQLEGTPVEQERFEASTSPETLVISSGLAKDRSCTYLLERSLAMDEIKGTKKQL